MQAHEERKNFAEKYYPQGWREMRVSERKLELAQSLPSVSILCICKTLWFKLVKINLNGQH